MRYSSGATAITDMQQRVHRLRLLFLLCRAVSKPYVTIHCTRFHYAIQNEIRFLVLILTASLSFEKQPNLADLWIHFNTDHSDAYTFRDQFAMMTTAAAATGDAGVGIGESENENAVDTPASNGASTSRWRLHTLIQATELDSHSNNNHGQRALLTRRESRTELLYWSSPRFRFTSQPESMLRSHQVARRTWPRGIGYRVSPSASARGDDLSTSSSLMPIPSPKRQYYHSHTFQKVLQSQWMCDYDSDEEMTEDLWKPAVAYSVRITARAFFCSYLGKV